MRPAAIALLLALALLVPAARADTLEEGAEMTTYAEGLQRPVALAFGPDGALYYAELDGGLRVIRPGASSPDPEPLWTPPNLQTGGERGFVGLALDPDFEETRAFFVFYTHNASGTITNRVSKVVDGEEAEILWGLRAGLLHNSGRLAFLPDKTLLVSAGDTILDTAGPHLARHAHDENDLAGKVLRIHRDGSVPADNPFGNEVWTKGHRNVFGLAASPDGVVIGTENGPEKSDEVNVLVPGNDYGWPTCKGACDEEDPADARGRYTDPVLEYESTISPTGATWHQGYFYFSDFNKGRIHRIYELPDGTWADERVVRLDQPRILDITTGPGGLYFSTWDSIHKVTLDERWTSGGPTPTTPATPDPDDEPPVGSPPAPDDDADGNGGNGATTPETIEGDAGTPGPGLAVVLAATAVALAARRRG